jgi:hypothetical protein
MAFGNLRAFRICAGLSGLVLAVSCIASLQAQTAQQSYGFCSAMSPSSSTVYVSNVFSVPAASSAGARGAFTQYMQTRDKTASAGNCSMVASQQQANTMKQTAESRLKQTSSGGKTINVVETGWSYQAAATATTPTGAATTTTGAVTNSATGAVNAAGQSIQQNATQSVESVQQSATQSLNNTVTNGMSALQAKLFHKGGSGQNNAAQGQQQPAANTGTTAPATNGAPVAQNVVATAPAPTKPTIQDEGDGKHSLLMTPGQKDAIELTQVEGSKNVYLDEATGDKYVVMPSGDITHVPHRTAAAAATTSATK